MWQNEDSVYWRLVAILACFKSLLIPAYHSTDFEVHRNWLAITHSLPLSQWYKTNISQWTIDYPPLFAWMEKGLSYPALMFDPKMLDVENLNYASQATIIYQRLTVILTEMVYVYAVFSFMKLFMKKQTSKNLVPCLSLAIIFITNFGLLLVDNIHFQYNGILFGIMLLSILKLHQEKFVEASFWFSILLCMKHIFLYIAPVYGIYLLKRSIYNEKGERYPIKSIIYKLASLGAVVCAVFSFTFLPFVIIGQSSNVFSRLFPFKRGLCHAYWAPNFWAIYNVLDKAVIVIAKILGLSTSIQTKASMTGGLVQEFEHAYLPSIKPIHTFIITALFMLPAVKIAWKQKQGINSFVRALVLCAYSSFMFGWHVHEKAILIITIPFTLLAFESKRDSKLFLFLTCVANFSLFPLIFTIQEMPIKYILCVMNLVLYFYLITSHHKIPENDSLRLPLMTSLESLYLTGLVVMEIYSSLLHTILFGSALPFVPLMLTSFYCSVGVTYVYLRMLFSC